MRRREFIAGLAGSAAWSATVRAQQPAVPVIGFLSISSPEQFVNLVRAFRQGLGEVGYAEGRNLNIEYRWAKGQNDLLPELAADLARRRVSAIFASGGVPGALAAKAATTTIPTVFYVAADPVELGLVASLSRPGGNLTGVSNLNTEVEAKRLELLHESVPTATVIGLLINPTSPTVADAVARDLRAAAPAPGVQLNVLRASTDQDFERVFAALAELRVAGLVIGTDAFFNTRSERLASLAIQHAVPAIYQYREFAAAGGLISYGSNPIDGFRLAGNYVGRILKGEKAGDLPVQRATKIEMFVNLKTAKALGLTIPDLILVRADEVIE